MINYFLRRVVDDLLRDVVVLLDVFRRVALALLLHPIRMLFCNLIYMSFILFKICQSTDHVIAECNDQVF